MAGEATLRRITSLDPIEGADKIEVATIGGWKVVVQKNIHKVDDLVVFIQVDTWLPENPIWAFLDKAPREYEGYGLGYRVRTIKLRGQISQGVVLPLKAIKTDEFDNTYGISVGGALTFAEGVDISTFLGAKHWQKPIPVNLSGKVKGNFPSFIPKTDQERAQNILDKLLSEEYKVSNWELSTKLDGSSITVYYKDGQLGVCSRNLELDLSDTTNIFVKTAVETGILEILKLAKKNWAIQGELVGPRVQDNNECLGRPDIFVYDIYDIDQGAYLTPDTRQRAVLALGLRHVPALRILKYEFTNIEDLLNMAKGPSMIGEMREGLVFKHEDGKMSFKITNNDYMLAKGE